MTNEALSCFMDEFMQEAEREGGIFGDDRKAELVRRFLALPLWERNLYALYLHHGSGSKVSKALHVDRRTVDRELRRIEQKLKDNKT